MCRQSPEGDVSKASWKVLDFQLQFLPAEATLVLVLVSVYSLRKSKCILCCILSNQEIPNFIAVQKNQGH